MWEHDTQEPRVGGEVMYVHQCERKPPSPQNREADSVVNTYQPETGYQDRKKEEKQPIKVQIMDQNNWQYKFRTATTCNTPIF